MVTVSLYQPSGYSSKTRAVNTSPNSAANKTYVQGLRGTRRSKLFPSERLLGGVEYIGRGEVIENMVSKVADDKNTTQCSAIYLSICLNKQKFIQ